MAREYWIKILEITPEELVHLEELGFQLNETLFLDDVYFSHCLWNLRQAGWQFRLRYTKRRNGEEYLETAIKKPPDEDNQRQTKRFLWRTPLYFTGVIWFWRILGFTVHTRRQKHRTTYRRGAVEIQVDCYTGIPPYAEVTGSRDHCNEVLQELQIPTERTTDKTVSGVFAHYGIKDSTRVLFEGSPD